MGFLVNFVCYFAGKSLLLNLPGGKFGSTSESNANANKKHSMTNIFDIEFSLLF